MLEEECNVTQEHPTKLSFSIEESVWLNKGQEVQEIVGMSLEPDISIEERDHHVYIKGGLRLVGEYHPAKTESGIDLEGSIEDQVAFRSVGDVSLSEDGTGKITHFFPIDVTIPISRIHNLDDVYVQIDSFDYDLPERSCIQLTADISISGMNHHQEVAKKREAPPAAQKVKKEESVDPSFAFDAKRAGSNEHLISPPQFHPEQRAKPPQTQMWQPSAFSQYGYQQPLPTEGDTEEAVEPQDRVEGENHETWDYEFEGQLDASEYEDAYEEVEEEQRAEEQEDADVYEEEIEVVDEGQEDVEEDLEYEVEDDQQDEVEPAAEERVEEVEVEEQVEEQVVEEVEEIEQEVEVEAEEESVGPLTKMAARAPEPVYVEAEAEAAESEEAEQVVAANKPREENALYLTKMLTKGEERFSKWRMCIIQPNETINTIADRYNISTSQIARMNQLTEEKVEEGQILYIPTSAKS